MIIHRWIHVRSDIPMDIKQMFTCKIYDEGPGRLKFIIECNEHEPKMMKFYLGGPRLRSLGKNCDEMECCTNHDHVHIAMKMLFELGCKQGSKEFK